MIFEKLEKDGFVINRMERIVTKKNHTCLALNMEIFLASDAWILYLRHIHFCENEAMIDPLVYHAYPHPGKIKTLPSKPLILSLAYTPGVAQACLAIAHNPAEVDRFTIRRSLVAVISNGTAVLGLGNIGPLASKPVMEGKVVLFQVFAQLNAISLEIQEEDPEKLIEMIARLEPSFGGINLEDIKAPECFYIEEALKKRLSIPIFHDDQHGTAITVCAALLNALLIVKKNLETVNVVVSGAGASALACLRLLRVLGLPLSHITLCDRQGVIYKGRSALSSYKKEYAKNTPFRHLAEAIVGADVFLGLSCKGLVTPSMISSMAAYPIVFPLANPDPEIEPHHIFSVRKDVIVGSGRSDATNQVNNLLCFPYMFRGALDVGAKTINQEMMIACVKELQSIAQEGFSDITGHYDGHTFDFGKDYFIPKPFDPRLLERLPLAIAKAALNSGVATAGLNLDAYRDTLRDMAYRPAVRYLQKQERLDTKIFYVLTGSFEKDRLLVAVAQGMRFLCSPHIVGERTWLSGLSVGILPFVDLDSFSPLAEDICIFGQENSCPLPIKAPLLYGYEKEKSAVFSCTDADIDQDLLIQMALMGIAALGYQPQCVMGQFPDSLTDGIGYLPIDHSFPLRFGQDFSWTKGHLLGKFGPFALYSRWQIAYDDISLPELMDLSCFAQAMP